MADNIEFDSSGRPVGFDSSMDDRAWLYEGPQRETAYWILDEAGNTVVFSSAGEAFRPAGGDPLGLEFLGNATHEMKTPPALIRAQIELKEEGRNDRDSLLSDVEYMIRQVQQLLLLAEASEAHNYHFTTVGMQEVAHDAAAYLQRMAESAEVHLAVRAVGEVTLKADRAACFTLLKNLLENAIQHDPAQSSVSVGGE